MKLNFRKLFGFHPKQEEPYKYADVLHLYEDDSLMIELLPKENLEFIKSEIRRIRDFGRKHFDGSGFSDITEVGEASISTKDLKIPISELMQIFDSTDLKRIEKLVMEGVGLLEGEQVPLAYGSNNFAILLEGKSNHLESVSFTGRTKTNQDRDNLKLGLMEFLKRYDFIGVNWFRTEYYELDTEKQIEIFIEKNC